MKRERGWMIPYLIHGDEVFGAGRLAWWMDVEIEGALPAGDIPQIEFRNSNSNTVSSRGILSELDQKFAIRKSCNGKRPPRSLAAAGATAHINDLVMLLGGGWTAMLYLVRWLAWALRVGQQQEAPQEPQPGWDALLYECFELGRLQAADADIFGTVISDSIGKGSKWNTSAFYPTPQEVCELMVQMTMSDRAAVHPDKDHRLLSVCDPCVGTGRMLLSASNYSVNLSGCDIDPLMVDCCAINMALYAPWGVYQTPRQKELLGTAGAQLPEVAEVIAEQRVGQGHSKVENPAAFDSHGQGLLFSFASKTPKSSSKQ